MNDGTPLKCVDVKIDEGEWHRATVDSTNPRYRWTLFTFRWDEITRAIGETPKSQLAVFEIRILNRVDGPVRQVFSQP